ncbi:retrovirus-related pol polyprotein from transposon RE1 [Tanacetum coccineum]
MTKELKSLESNHTWTLSPLPPNKSPIGSKWVYRIKYNSDGSIERFKAKLVAKGCTQKEGTYYNETFAPVAKMVTVRTLLVTAVQHNWHIAQLDINNAFLHGDLHEEVYMALPQGYIYNSTIPNPVYKLQKSLYGLKQANRQCAEVLDLKPSHIHVDPIAKLNDTNGELLSDPSQYKTLVGKLLYLTLTRHDLSYAAHCLSQFRHNPRTLHLKALIKLIVMVTGQAVKQQEDLPLVFAFSLDHVSFPGNLKSNQLSQGSSIEAEYRALADSANPVQHARTKHIEIDCHFVREKIKAGILIPIFTSTHNQVVDVLTKGLSRSPFHKCISMFGMCDPYTLPTCRGGNGYKEAAEQRSYEASDKNTSRIINSIISSNY